MIQIRKSSERGHANQGWLDTYHTFSFADYYDPKFIGFRDLLVINEDRVAPGRGFGRHPHDNMEIVTVVLEGELAHKDSMGSGSVIRPGDVQRMSAGTGVIHSEFNNSLEHPVHLFQIWITPENSGIEPEYEEKRFQSEEKLNLLKLIVSPTGEEGSVRIHQDAKIYSSVMEAGRELKHVFGPRRYGWVQVAKGSIVVNETLLNEGDGASISEEQVVKIRAIMSSQFLIFDLS